MLDGARIAVVVPAYREARLLGRMLPRIPPFVDAVYVVDDASDDGTRDVANASTDERVRCLVHAENRGVGAAIVSGYEAALRDGHDVLAVMAGDDQMHPDDLVAVVRAVLAGAAYAKGNRFVHPEARRMPPMRRAGGELLSLLTRVTTGLRVSDSQCGYTALAATAATALPLAELFPRYGYPNDLLGMLAARDLRVVDVPVRPVYADERSGLRPWHAARILYVIARRWWRERVTATARSR
jgi:glycosyltransferase involved in cell wall biosynthesis